MKNQKLHDEINNHPNKLEILQLWAEQTLDDTYIVEQELYAYTGPNQ